MQTDHLQAPGSWLLAPGSWLLLILGWWAFAFYLTSARNDQAKASSSSFGQSVILRHTVKQALEGDMPLMKELMSNWEKDAHFLIQSGVPGIQLMPEVRRPNPIAVIADDAGNEIALTPPMDRFLPQTYLAATVLLALVSPEHIVAIPKGMRDFPYIYPPLLLDQIPLDIDRYNSETLYQLRPDVAFVAHYSHPATLDALKSQGVPLFMITHVDTIPEILNAISRIGYLANQQEKTEHLLAFVEAAMRSIDNQLRALAWKTSSSQRIAFLHYSNRFSMPTAKNLSGQLLQRINRQVPALAVPVHDSLTEWKVPLTHEGIACLNPQGLILSCMLSGQDQLPQIPSEAIHSLPTEKIVFIDEMIQQSLSQHIVLAYLDIFHALEKLHVDLK